MIIKCCRECPFYQKTLLTLLAGKAGMCGYDAKDDSLVSFDLDMEPGPARIERLRRAHNRMVIDNDRGVPTGCPLREKDVTITLAKN
jgi:hypothetical protein